VYIELLRRKKECDFLIKQDLSIIQAIQVTKTLSDPDKNAREIAGLLEAMSTAHLTEGLILTLAEEGTKLIIDNEISYHITVMPVWKWLITDHRVL
jgi:predicted AAA+ superfamily ATPase